MKIGIFGGAFDPFHSQHKQIIIKAKEELDLDKVVVVPSFVPPHKQNSLSDYDLRVKMVMIGTKDLDFVIVDTIEKTRGKNNATYQVLPELIKKYGEDIYFIIGGDSLAHFHTWLKPELVAKMANLAVIKRKGYEEFDKDIARIKNTFNANIVQLSTIGELVSSRDIKARLELGVKSTDLEENVYNFIINNNMYTKYKIIVDKLQESISERTFAHSVRTTLFAMKYSTQLRLSFEEVFLSALLHDCAKNTKEIMEGVPQPVVHQFVGRKVARDRFGVEKELILDAIEYHTTGKANMTQLGKLIFVADMLEENRDFEGVIELRELLKNDFEKGFLACVTHSYNYIKGKNMPVYYLTKECKEGYTSNENTYLQGFLSD